MNCKSSHCECTAAARAACDVRLTRAEMKKGLDNYGEPQAMPTRTGYEAACSVPPSQRTRVDWVFIRDNAASIIRCRLSQNAKVDSYAITHRQAVEALEAMPVSVHPIELARLQDRDNTLALIENEVRPALAAHRKGANAAQHLLDWLRRSSILRGVRI